MDLADLLTFRAVVECGGITRAAARLHRVQSNVTARIKNLEEDLGAQLFARQGRGVVLAPAGQVLLGYAERLLDLADEARAAVRGGDLSGLLRLGAMESTAAVRLPGPLAEFHRRYPGITLDLKTDSTQPLIAQVLRGDLDAALVAEPVEDPRLESRAIYDEDLLILRPAASEVRPGMAVTLLTFRPGCSYRRRLEDWVCRAGMAADRIVEINSHQVILGCVAAGMGITLAPASLLAGYEGRARLAALPLGPEGRVRTLLIWRKGAPAARIEALAQSLAAAIPDATAG
ncbi:HTH-type transcriptional regulator GltR [mine drainage metagenome]|uniref:HTH-type transcriptional regulator GltR n=1 Tax=mine drainage metagenome TaxID=410659 RepID=A0A1J5T810_9ZZZZ